MHGELIRRQFVVHGCCTPELDHRLKSVEEAVERQRGSVQSIVYRVQDPTKPCSAVVCYALPLRRVASPPRASSEGGGVVLAGAG